MARVDLARTGAPAPIPTPPGFPVVWERPGDESLTWMRERMHFPQQLSPLTGSIMTKVVWEGGLNPWVAAFELPASGVRAQMVNTYFYWAREPLIAPPDELAVRAKRSEDKLEAVLARFGALWEEEWLPEIKQHLSFWERFDLSGATPPALSGHLEDSIRRLQRIMEIHFRIALPAPLASSLFEELYRDLFSADDAFDPYRLQQGFDNKSLEIDRALWQLSRSATADMAVAATFETCDAARVLPALEAQRAGNAFLAEIHTFLAKYGMRSDRLSFDWPSWIEDPTPVIDSIKSYMRQPDRDLAREIGMLAEKREGLVARARQRLKGYPQPVVDHFEVLLGAAQAATVLQEDHNFWIDHCATYQFRRLILELGRRFAAVGALPTPDDVFLFKLDELRDTARDLAERRPAKDRQYLILARKAVQDHFRHIAQPEVLGTPPQGPPPDSPYARAMYGKFYGMRPKPVIVPGVLRGISGSSGKARGPVKVVRLLSEGDKLQPGDVLVAETTLPAWTPLFATAAAVVTDTGGILSHCAIVAREYRIPAVVGAVVATATLRDGQIVEVDGDAGEVRIVASA